MLMNGRVLGGRVLGSQFMGALTLASLFGGLACSSEGMSGEEFETQELALIEAAGNGPTVVTAAPTIELSKTQTVQCPVNRYYAIMRVPPLEVQSTTPSVAVQPEPTTVLSAVCPDAPGYDSGYENGVCYYDNSDPYSDPPDVDGALTVTRAVCLAHHKGGGTPEEKVPLVNNYYPDLNILLVVFPTDDLKVQLVRDPQSKLVLVSKTTALTPYTKTLAVLPTDSKVRADFVDSPSGWVNDYVTVE